MAALSATPHPVFDLLVLDYYLPASTGKEILVHLSSLQSPRRFPVVVLSSHLSLEARAELVTHGARAVLEKPFDYDGYRRLAHYLIEVAR